MLVDYAGVDSTHWSRLLHLFMAGKVRERQRKEPHLNTRPRGKPPPPQPNFLPGTLTLKGPTTSEQLHQAGPSPSTHLRRTFKMHTPAGYNFVRVLNSSHGPQAQGLGNDTGVPESPRRL